MKKLLKAVVVALGCSVLMASVASAQKKPSPFDTTATVMAKSDDKVIPLKREEQIAFMFVDAIQNLLGDCGAHAAEPCTLPALVRGPKAKDDWGMGKLKFDPNATDPNYTYEVTLDGNDWEVRANPRKPGLGSFYHFRKDFHKELHYRADGRATKADPEITESGYSGDMFWIM